MTNTEKAKWSSHRNTDDDKLNEIIENNKMASSHHKAINMGTASSH
jgi:hypothetical protein